MIENSQTKNIEVAIEAFRTIKKAVQEYGFYPRDLKATPLDDEDMDSPTLRQRLRNTFEDYTEIYYAIYNRVLPSLTESMRNIESEYNYLTINSRNLKKALDLFTSKISENLFDFESILKRSGHIKFFIVPLRSHSIISDEEADIYFKTIDDIGYNYCQAAIHIRNVFNIKQPWSDSKWDEDRKKLQSLITDSDDYPQSENGGELADENDFINFQKMQSYNLAEGKDIPYAKLYTFLINSKTIKSIDKETFINCITHAYFKPLYETGIHINILHVIRTLESYFGKEWRVAVCESIGIETKRVTQDAPKTDFPDKFDAVLKEKNPDK